MLTKLRSGWPSCGPCAFPLQLLILTPMTQIHQLTPSISSTWPLLFLLKNKRTQGELLPGSHGMTYSVAWTSSFSLLREEKRLYEGRTQMHRPRSLLDAQDGKRKGIFIFLLYKMIIHNTRGRRRFKWTVLWRWEHFPLLGMYFPVGISF
jgi:hypothetical protein